MALEIECPLSLVPTATEEEMIFEEIFDSNSTGGGGGGERDLEGKKGRQTSRVGIHGGGRRIG
ncbi:hypothetical protein C4D60_Mb08t31590 [Musa balbisiana]|uniref:Uncharacterized protein n=1 Tax=Musa balbisiana TaxID=52838 RepID=A0A4S8K7X9_MUSBA|nr:hypothetical protein C4D60_Mb08t31590 [Musa balbisiana]